MDSKFVCPFFFVKAAGLLVDEQQRIVTPLIKVNMRVSHNISELKCRNCAHPRLLLALLRTVQQPERDLQLFLTPRQGLVGAGCQWARACFT
jgi:hypothetical protein